MFENSKLLTNSKSLLRFLLNKFNIPYELWFYKDPPEKISQQNLSHKFWE